jgi:hypothetical protein
METLKHEDVNVPFALGGNAITAVFDMEAQILSLLMDESTMQQDNIADGQHFHWKSHWSQSTLRRDTYW